MQPLQVLLPEIYRKFLGMTVLNYLGIFFFFLRKDNFKRKDIWD